MKHFIISLLTLMLIATASPAVFAQSQEIQEKLTETKSKIEQLAEIKDSQDVSEEEKLNVEFDLKKEILGQVLNLGILQMDETKKTIEKTSFPDTEEWNQNKAYVLEQIAQHRSYYTTTKEELSQQEELTLEYIQQIAQAVELHKKEAIDQFIKELNDVIAVFNISDVLSLADQRLEKVQTDITKIYNKKLAKDDSLKELFRQASDTLQTAHTINNNAKELILHRYNLPYDEQSMQVLENTVTALTSASSTQITTFIQKEVPEIISQEQSITDDVTSTEPQEPEYVLSPEARTLIHQELRTFVVDSLTNIKDTYATFVEMSIQAQHLLR
jgi:hypothetical protein